VHRDTRSFPGALRAALRADPDVVMVGEVRDTETMPLALTAAETGHLVMATLHTVSAARPGGRGADLFPSAEKPLARALLANSLRGVASQALAQRQAAPGNQTVAYLCHANHCSAPLNSPQELEAQLKTGESGRG